MEDSNQKNDNTLLEQYKVYIHSLEELRNRKTTTNLMFISLSIAMLTLTPFFDQAFNLPEKLLPLMAGILLVYLWKIFLNSYKKHELSKLHIILNLEKKLPCRCFNEELGIRSNHVTKIKRYLEIHLLQERLLLVLKILFMAILIYIALRDLNLLPDFPF